MNAMTSQDTTMYPFATLNDQDFKNLLDVYLDATFFPNLNELRFYARGSRLEIKRNETGDEKLLLKGVVFNEMKGAMSSVSSQLYQGLSEFLYPETTYKYNSGGDPLKKIPDLTYEDLFRSSIKSTIIRPMHYSCHTEILILSFCKKRFS